MSIELVLLSNYLILCASLLLLHSVFPSIRVFTSESVLHIRWPNIGASASASVLPVNIQSWFPLGINWFDLLEVQGLSRFFSSNAVQKHQFFSAQLSLWSISHICTWLLEKPLLLLFSHSVMSNSATPWIAAHQISLSITNSQSSLRLTSIESVMPSNHPILCRPLLLLPSIFPSIRVFSNESGKNFSPRLWG